MIGKKNCGNEGRISSCLLIFFVILSAETFSQPRSDEIDLKSRREMAEHFAVDFPERLGQAAIERIEEGLTDPDSDVLANYLYALQRIGRAYGLSFNGLAEASPPILITESMGNRLRELVSHPNEKLAYDAAVTLALVSRHTDDFERMMVKTVLEKERLMENGSMLISLVATPSVQTAELRHWLIREVSIGSHSNAESAALAFMSENPMPPELLPGLIDRLSDTENYCNEHFLIMIRNYEEQTKVYREELGRLKLEFDHQVSLDPAKRTVQLSNEYRTQESFDKLISYINSI
jgi:hypothetical protein